MNQRWYDKDPTLSMAFSLLQNASAAHQEMAARYVFKLLESLNMLDTPRMRTGKTGNERLRFIFPPFRRSRLETHARQLVEVIKHLPEEHQQTAAVQLINYIYILDCGMTEPPLPASTFSGGREEEQLDSCI